MVSSSVIHQERILDRWTAIGEVVDLADFVDRRIHSKTTLGASHEAKTTTTAAIEIQDGKGGHFLTISTMTQERRVLLTNH